MTKDMPRDLLDELVDLYKRSSRQPGDFTSQELAKKLGTSLHTAQRVLKKEMDEGRIERVRVETEGRLGSVWVYRRIKGKS